MKLVTPEQMQEIDRETIEERGVPGSELMERAGQAVAREVYERFVPDSVAVVAGKGNNGGDGYVAARGLAEQGVRVRVFLLADPEELKGDARGAWERMPENVEQVRMESGDGLAEELAKSDVILDAIFGTGLSGPARGIYGEAIEAINTAANKSGAIVVAVDSPSGLIAGASEGEQSKAPCVQARLTITIGLPKVDLMLGAAGVRATGLVSVAEIGFPRDLLTSDKLTINLLTEAEMAVALPARDPGGHKGTFGRVLILGGGEGMTGAAIMAARSAVRSGTGLVYVAYPQALGPIFEATLIEPVKLPLGGDEKYFTEAMAEAALAEAEKVDAVALGPGIGQRPGTEKFVRAMLEGVKAPMVIDADGLNLLAEQLSALKARSAPTILTPHPGEAGRLLGRSVKDVQADRLNAFVDFAREHEAMVALKGFQTVITVPDGQRYVNPTGNSGLAKGGSGDVLTGLVTGLLAQGCDAVTATQLGVFLHGVAADMAAKKWGPRAMAPGDLPEHFGEAFRFLEERDEVTGSGGPAHP